MFKVFAFEIMGGQTSNCGCCASFDTFENEERKYAADRPTKRKHKKRHSKHKYDINDHGATCCGCKKCPPWVIDSDSESSMSTPEIDKLEEYQSEQQMDIQQQVNYRHNIKDEDDIKLPSASPNIPLSKLSDIVSPSPKINQYQDEVKVKENRFSKVTKSNCLQILTDLGVLQSVYVPKSEYDRWTLSHLIFKRLNINMDLHITNTDNKHGIYTPISIYFLCFICFFDQVQHRQSCL